MSFEHNFFVKPTAAVHIRNTLTLTQRKIVNILLKDSSLQLSQDIIHILSISEIIKHLGWKESSKTNQLILNSIKKLNCCLIDWNIFNKDKTQIWETSPLLVSSKISKGILEYSYSKPLSTRLSKATLFAKLSLNIQKNFSNKHALALWEYLSEYLCSSKANHAQLEPISLDHLKQFLGLHQSKAYSSFFLFKAKVLQPALAELNQHSDLRVTCRHIKQERKVVAMIFNVKKHLSTSTIPAIEEAPLKAINPSLFIDADYLQLSKSLIEKHLESYGIQKVERVLKQVKQEIEAGNKIRSITAYYLHCLRNDYEKAGDGASSNIKPIKPNFLELAHNDHKLANVLQSLFNKIGSKTFSSWFQDVELSILENNILKLRATSKFYADYISTNFSKELIEASKDTGANFRHIEVYP
jgi:hypothetical protein